MCKKQAFNLLFKRYEMEFCALPQIHTHTRTHTHLLGLEKNGLHFDEGEVVEQRQALVADVGEFIPEEHWESALCGRTVHCFCSEFSSHLEISHLDGQEDRRGNLSRDNV